MSQNEIKLSDVEDQGSTGKKPKLRTDLTKLLVLLSPEIKYSCHLLLHQPNPMRFSSLDNRWLIDIILADFTFSASYISHQLSITRRKIVHFADMIFWNCQSELMKTNLKIKKYSIMKCIFQFFFSIFNFNIFNDFFHTIYSELYNNNISKLDRFPNQIVCFKIRTTRNILCKVIKRYSKN